VVFHALATKTEVGGAGSGDAHARFDVAEGGRVGTPPFFTEELSNPFEGVHCLFQTLGCIWPLADYQAMLACQQVLGHYKRPSNLHAAIEQERRRPPHSFVNTRRHSTEADYHKVRNELLHEPKECRTKRHRIHTPCLADRSNVSKSSTAGTRKGVAAIRQFYLSVSLLLVRYCLAIYCPRSVGSFQPCIQCRHASVAKSILELQVFNMARDDQNDENLMIFLRPDPLCEVMQMSGTDLAYIGDVVFELFVRSYYVWPSKRTSELQHSVVNCVRGTF